jgi:hypothetical protein
MDMPVQARRWQARLDAYFPHGMLTASAEDPYRRDCYVTPRPEVVRMSGLDPVVFLEFPVWDRNLSGVVRGWEPLRSTPCHVVRVTFDMGKGGQGHDETQLWSGNISPAHARMLAPDRRRSLLLSAQGRLYQGAEEP